MSMAVAAEELLADARTVRKKPSALPPGGAISHGRVVEQAADASADLYDFL